LFDEASMKIRDFSLVSLACDGRDKSNIKQMINTIFNMTGLIAFIVLVSTLIIYLVWFYFFVKMYEKYK